MQSALLEHQAYSVHIGSTQVAGGRHPCALGRDIGAHHYIRGNDSIVVGDDKRVGQQLMDRYRCHVGAILTPEAVIHDLDAVSITGPDYWLAVRRRRRWRLQIRGLCRAGVAEPVTSTQHVDCLRTFPDRIA